jgi:hypothetical protein
MSTPPPISSPPPQLAVHGQQVSNPLEFGHHFVGFSLQQLDFPKIPTFPSVWSVWSPNLQKTLQRPKMSGKFLQARLSRSLFTGNSIFLTFSHSWLNLRGYPGKCLDSGPLLKNFAISLLAHFQRLNRKNMET